MKADSCVMELEKKKICECEQEPRGTVPLKLEAID
jgi:hypothetical protein